MIGVREARKRRHAKKSAGEKKTRKDTCSRIPHMTAWWPSGSPAWPRRWRSSASSPILPRSAFEERLGLMVDREAIERENKRLVTD